MLPVGADIIRPKRRYGVPTVCTIDGGCRERACPFRRWGVSNSHRASANPDCILPEQACLFPTVFNGTACMELAPPIRAEIAAPTHRTTDGVRRERISSVPKRRDGVPSHRTIVGACGRCLPKETPSCMGSHAGGRCLLTLHKKRAIIFSETYTLWEKQKTHRQPQGAGTPHGLRRRRERPHNRITCTQLSLYTFAVLSARV